MDIRHLRYFVAVAEEGHITRAAERLGIQQPPLSQQIRALEQELGATLLTRHPRGVSLTQAGETFLAEAQSILQRLDEARAATQRTGRGEAGRIGIGFTSSASFHPLVPRVIREFREAYPGVALSLDESGTAELIDGLRQGRLDAALVRSPIPPASGIVVHALLREPMIAAVPAGHRLTTQAAPLPLAELAAEIFILYRRPLGPGLYDGIIAACDRAGFSPRIGQEAPRMLATLSLVAAGLGVTLVPQSMRLLHPEGVVYRALDDTAPIAPLNLACRGDERSVAARRFAESVRQAAGGLKPPSDPGPP